LNITHIIAIATTVATVPLAEGQLFHIPENVVSNAFAGRNGAFVIIECSSETISDYTPNASTEKLAPCSTFKIWNTLIGLENGVITSDDEMFYEWDGEKRSILEWNKNLTLKEAFSASCVPAFQNLARKIGPMKMQSWLDKIDYGDRNMSAGIDVFWLPATGRKVLLITPMEQANLICKLIKDKLPFTKESRSVLKKIMTIKTTDRGVLYGKTGSRTDDTGRYNLGWFVGYSEYNGETYAFACTTKGDNVMGKDALAIVETILKQQGLL